MQEKLYYRRTTGYREQRQYDFGWVSPGALAHRLSRLGKLLSKIPDEWRVSHWCLRQSRRFWRNRPREAGCKIEWMELLERGEEESRDKLIQRFRFEQPNTVRYRGGAIWKGAQSIQNARANGHLCALRTSDAIFDRTGRNGLFPSVEFVWIKWDGIVWTKFVSSDLCGLEKIAHLMHRSGGFIFMWNRYIERNSRLWWIIYFRARLKCIIWVEILSHIRCLIDLFTCQHL